MSTIKMLCSNCNKEFDLRKCLLKPTRISYFCCSRCWHDYRYRGRRIGVSCKECGKAFMKLKKEMRLSKSGFSFCSNSCSAKYSNANRSSIGRRSKIEIKFGQELQKLFPDLEFIFNGKIEGYELDIYIPKLQLAIEWNGKVHYQPIYGEDKLNNTQYRDYQKQLICQKLSINLIVICDLTSCKKILYESIQKVKSIIEVRILEIESSPDSPKLPMHNHHTLS